VDSYGRFIASHLVVFFFLGCAHLFILGEELPKLLVCLLPWALGIESWDVVKVKKTGPPCVVNTLCDTCVSTQWTTSDQNCKKNKTVRFASCIVYLSCKLICNWIFSVANEVETRTEN
jgi:hypothetical protein